MATNRRAEKMGWTAGWAGGFVWVALLSVVFLVQGMVWQGLLGMSLTAAAIVSSFSFAPWRHPTTPYWKLMLAPYGIFFAAIAWALWSYGGPGALGLSWWNLLWLIPALGPFGFLSNRTWAEPDRGQGVPHEARSSHR